MLRLASHSCSSRPGHVGLQGGSGASVVLSSTPEQPAAQQFSSWCPSRARTPTGDESTRQARHSIA